MTNLIIQVSKYLSIILMALYTFQCFTVFQKKDDEAREYLFLRQNMLIYGAVSGKTGVVRVIVLWCTGDLSCCGAGAVP